MMNQAPDPNRYDGARIKAALRLLHHYEKSEPLRKAQAAHHGTLGFVCRSLAGTLGSRDVDSGHMLQWLERVREHVERLERERDDARTAASRIANAYVRACPA